MDRVDKLLHAIVEREGGLSDHPDDTGGITNHGISLRYAKQKNLDLNGDGTVDEQDIRLVTKDKAVELYREDFYTGPGIDRLPEALQPLMTDFAVNSGPGRAVRELQDTLERQRQTAPSILGDDEIAVDGVIGSNTVDAAERAQKAMGAYLVNALCNARLDFLNQIVEKDPSQKAFLDGWQKRVREFMVA